MVSLGIVGPPESRFTLPVSTLCLVSWTLISGGAFVMLGYAGVGLVLNILFDAQWPILKPMLVGGMVFIVAAAAEWSIDFPKNLRGLIGITIAAPIGVLFIAKALPFLKGITDQHYWHELSAVDVCLMGSVSAVAYFITVVGVSQARRGQAISLTNIGRWLESKLDFIRRRPRHFRSPAEAQLWLEWTQRGFALPVAVAVLCALGIAMSIVVGFLNSADLAAGHQLEFLFGLSTVVLLIAGPSLGSLDQDGLEDGMTQMKATRPMTCQALANTMLKNVALSTFVMGVVWWTGSALMLAVLYSFGAGPYSLITEFNLDQFGTSTAGIVCATVTWSLGGYLVAWTVVAIGASIASLRKWAAVAILAGIITLPFISAIAFNVLVPPAYRFVVGQTIATIVIVAILLAIVGVFAIAMRLKLISPRLCIVCGVAVIIASTVASGWAVHEPDLARAPLWCLVAIPLTAFALSVYPFAGAPLAIWWSRHR
jgi:hypothetical protein